MGKGIETGTKMGTEPEPDAGMRIGKVTVIGMAVTAMVTVTLTVTTGSRSGKSHRPAGSRDVIRAPLM